MESDSNVTVEDDVSLGGATCWLVSIQELKYLNYKALYTGFDALGHQRVQVINPDTLQEAPEFWPDNIFMIEPWE